MINGKPPDLVFQKSLDTFAKRHHIRIWKEPGTYQGRDVWIGAATHDIAISTEKAKTKWSHRIDPHIDREREWIETDLLYSKALQPPTPWSTVPMFRRKPQTQPAMNSSPMDNCLILVIGNTKPNILNTTSPVLQTRK